MDLYLLSLVEVVCAVLPEMVERAGGGILVGRGVSAIRRWLRRNDIHTLNAEPADTGVVHIAGVVLGGAGHLAVTSGVFAPGLDLSRMPTVDPADLMWSRLASRGRCPYPSLTVPPAEPFRQP